MKTFKVEYPKNCHVDVDGNKVEGEDVWYVQANNYSDATTAAMMNGLPKPVRIIDVEEGKNKS